MTTPEKLNDLIARLEKQRGPYMGDGINKGFTTTEVLEILYEFRKPCPIHKGVDKVASCCYSLNSL